MISVTAVSIEVCVELKLETVEVIEYKIVVSVLLALDNSTASLVTTSAPYSEVKSVPARFLNTNPDKSTVSSPVVKSPNKFTAVRSTPDVTERVNDFETVAFGL